MEKESLLHLGGEELPLNPGKDFELLHDQKLTFEERVITESTATRTNLDNRNDPKPFNFDNIFAKVKYEEHPRYQEGYIQPL
jgi:hypothetical protein